MVNPIDIFDILSDTAEGRRIGFQTFLDRFSGGNTGVAQRNRGIVGQFNRPFFSNLLGQAENEFFANQGTAIQNEEQPRNFTDFLNDDFDLGRRARRAPSQQLGRSTSRFAGPARFLFNQ